MSPELRQQVLESKQFLYTLNENTLLTIDLAAPLFGKAPATVRTDVTRQPHLLPPFIRIGHRVFFQKRDIDAFVESRKVNINPAPNQIQKALSPVLAPANQKQRGRPTKAQQAAKIAAQNK